MSRNMGIIILISILLISGISVKGSNDENSPDLIRINESFSLSDIEISEKENHVDIYFEESTSYFSKPEKPMVPIFYRVYTLPFGSKVKSVNVDYNEQQNFEIHKKIRKAPENRPLVKIETKKDNPFELKSKMIEEEDLYPSKDFEITTGTGIEDGKHVTFLVVYCYPAHVSTSEKIVYYNKQIDITIEYERPIRSPDFKDEYDLLIITPENLESNLQSLVNHKNTYNINTIVKTTEEIYQVSNGRDEAEKIKYFIHESLINWGIDYVLIIGDMDLTPMRSTDIEMYGEEELPTDLYYADIYNNQGEFCCWDADNDNVFGEYDWNHGEVENIDGVDLYSDVKVGRIPCKNDRELRIVLDKIITYETQTYNQKWFENLILMGGDTFPNRSPLEGEMVTGEISKELSNDFNSIKIWTSEGNFNWFNINSKITQGAGFVSYSGHGYEFGFGTSVPNEQERINYYTPYALGMLNKNKYPVIFFDACSTAKLDYNYRGIKLPTFAWFLLKKPVGGAVATIGATRVAFTMVDDDGIHGGAGFLNLHFFKAYNPGVSVSEMLVQSQNDYLNNGPWKDFVTIEEFILLGDPSLKIGGYPS